MHREHRGAEDPHFWKRFLPCWWLILIASFSGSRTIMEKPLSMPVGKLKDYTNRGEKAHSQCEWWHSPGGWGLRLDGKEKVSSTLSFTLLCLDWDAVLVAVSWLGCGVKVLPRNFLAVRVGIPLKSAPEQLLSCFPLTRWTQQQEKYLILCNREPRVFVELDWQTGRNPSNNIL